MIHVINHPYFFIFFVLEVSTIFPLSMATNCSNFARIHDDLRKSTQHILSHNLANEIGESGERFKIKLEGRTQINVFMFPHILFHPLCLLLKGQIVPRRLNRRITFRSGLGFVSRLYFAFDTFRGSEREPSSLWVDGEQKVHIK